MASLVRPVRELRRFEKLELQPGESRELVFTLTGADLAYHIDGARTTVEPGEFSVWVAPDAQSGKAAMFNVSISPNFASK